MFLKSLINDQAVASRGITAAIATDLAAARTAGVKPLYDKSVPQVVAGDPSVTFYETDPIAGSRIRLAHIVSPIVREQYNMATRRYEDVLSLAPREGFLLSEVPDVPAPAERTAFVDYGEQAETIGDISFTRTAFPTDRGGFKYFVNGIRNLDPKKGIFAGQFVLRDGAQDGMDLILRFVGGAAVLSVTTLEGSHTISLHRVARQENPKAGILKSWTEPLHLPTGFAPVPDMVSSSDIHFGEDETITGIFGSGFDHYNFSTASKMFDGAVVYVLPAKPKETSAAG